MGVEIETENNLLPRNIEIIYEFQVAVHMDVDGDIP
jgi:hypothetical protein